MSRLRESVRAQSQSTPSRPHQAGIGASDPAVAFLDLATPKQSPAPSLVPDDVTIAAAPQQPEFVVPARPPLPKKQLANLNTAAAVTDKPSPPLSSSGSDKRRVTFSPMNQVKLIPKAGEFDDERPANAGSDGTARKTGSVLSVPAHVPDDTELDPSMVTPTKNVAMIDNPNALLEVWLLNCC